MNHNSQQTAGCSNNSSYKGVRRRKSSGKWVSEIREPKKPTRIWLGSYPTQEMAAVAYDVAALALKGPGTQLNFPESAGSLPVPQSRSPRDIQAAAALAAGAAGSAADALNLENREFLMGQNDDEISHENTAKGKRVDCFMDEDLIFNMPNVLANMAEGMLLSPPPLDVPLNAAVDDDDDDEDASNSASGQNLWYHP